MSAGPPESGAGSASGKADPTSGELRQALREVRELMHDIRNHLNGILGLVSVLLLQSNDPAVLRLRPMIEGQAQQLTDLIDRLAESLRGIVPGRDAAAFAAARFVPALADLYRPFAAENGVHLGHFIDVTAPTLHVDTRALHRLLSNLLVNAINHSQASQVTVFVEPLDGRRGVRIVVADDGIGIAAEAVRSLQAVLSEGRQAAPGYDRSGLAICGDMAARLGAALTLNSDLGYGTSVSQDLVSGEEPAGALG